ncbi:MAG: hypothetical protein U1F81_18480 [Verrucomicrobiaceae bacterium]
MSFHHSLPALVLSIGSVATLFAQQTPQVVRLGDLNTSQVVLEAVAGGAGQTGPVVLFRGTDGEHGDEVWIVRGGAARLARDVRPGPESSDPGSFAPLGTEYFTCVADDGVTGPEVRVFNMDGYLESDSWAQTDLRPGAHHTAPVLLGTGNGIVWYAMDELDAGGSASQSVWAFSANEPSQRVGSYQRGTVQQASVVPGTSRLCFIARRHSEGDLSLFTVDGIQQEALRCGSMGTAAEAEPLPQPAYAATSSFVCFRQVYGNASLTAFHFANHQISTLQALGPSVTPWLASNGTDRVCFAGYDSANGIELWTTQGTPATTQRVSDLAAGAASSYPSRIQMVPGGLGVFFQTGAEGGNRSLYYISPTSDLPTFRLLSSQAHLGSNFTIVSNYEMAFTAPGGAGSQLWLGDGSSGSLNRLDAGSAIHRLWRPVSFDSSNRRLNWLTETSTQYRIGILGSGLQTPTLLSMEKPASGGHVPVVFQGAPASRVYVVGEDHDPQRRLWQLDGTGMSSTELLPLIPTSTYPSSASSHPADFFEIDGQLVFSAIPNGGRRVLYFSHTGENESFQVVGNLGGDLNLPGAYEVDQVVKLGSHLFFTGMAPGQTGGARRLFRVRYAPLEASNGGVISEAVSESGLPVEAQRLVVAAGKVFFVTSGATTETLRCVDASLNLVTVGVFAKDSLGEGISDLVGSPGLLFFSAVATSGPSAGQRTVWSTAGAAGVLATQPPPLLPGARLLGLLGTQIVFWTPDGSSFREWTWSGSSAEAPVERFQGSIQEQPVPSRDWRRPSGIENEGRFYFCDRLGRLVWFNTSDQYGAFNFTNDAQVLPEHLSVIGGQLLFHSLQRNQGAWFTHRWAGAAQDFLLGPVQARHPGPMFQHGGRMWFSRFVPGNPPDATELRSSDGLTVSDQPLMLSTRHATVMNAAGSYRGHLCLPARPEWGNYGTEPCIVNTPPDVPMPPTLQGARKEQPFSFTYAQLITGTASDAEGDTVSSPAISPPTVGTLKRNGAVVTAEIPILPGDAFEWMPPADQIGNVPVVHLIHRDPWSITETPVFIRVETPHDEWTRLHFTPTQLADPLVSGPEADADGDGVGNALEFLFGRLPHQREGEAGWSLTSTTPSPGQRRAVFTFKRLAVLPPGTTVLIEQSDDLLNWGTVAEKIENAAWTFPVAGVSVDEVALVDGRIETRVAVEESMALNRFLRLRLVLP